MTKELSIFDVVGVEDVLTEEEKAVLNAEEDKKAKANTVKPKTKPIEEFKVTAEWMIHFPTEAFRVSDFIDEVPKEGITLEEVRQGIERHFPKFSAARTKWDFDKDEKRLYPDAFAGSKGAIGEEGGRFTPSFFINIDDAAASQKFYRYVISKNKSVFALFDAPYGRMIVRIGQAEDDFVFEVMDRYNVTFRELPELRNSFEWKFSKIPGSIYSQIVSFFRSYVLENHQYEVALRIYYDTETASYVVACPKQRVTAVNIHFEHTNEYHPMRYLPVLEVHSHNVMRAFFSETDNKNEQSFNTLFGVFGVFGRLNKDEIETVFRAKMGEHEVPFKAEDIFDLSHGMKPVSYPAEWKQNVTLVEGLYL